MRKVLVTGAFGQLGIDVLSILRDEYDLLAVDLDLLAGFSFKGRKLAMDITSLSDLENNLKAWQPDVIVNLAAVTNVDECERNPELANLVNAQAVGNLLEAASKPGLHFIQISTDYLFDGTNGPYNENDPQNPINHYGRSKQQAERILMAGARDYTILRTNVVFGSSTHTGASFLKWLIDSLRAGKQVNIVDDQWNNPTWTIGLAEAVKTVIDDRVVGIFNYGGTDYLNRLEFARKIAQIFRLDTRLINSISTADLNQIAPRPLRCGLKNDKIAAINGIKLYSVEQAITKIFKQDSL